ncbi:hypothetical protein BH10ACI1_BH10ACI1_18190 [soil metagenome]
MKLSRISFLFLSLFLFVPSVALAQKKEILWDFRKDEIKTQKYSKAETNIVLKYLLGNQRNAELEITRRVAGSFIKANANETLYYIAGCEEDEGFTTPTDCSHANWWNAGWVAIYDGTTPKMKIKAALGSDIARITDINNDGINEILSLGVWSGQGVNLVGAIFGQIVNDKYKEIKTFRGYSDTCLVQEKARRFANATVISYVPSLNGTPTFSQEYFQNRCGNTAWKKITKKQFESVEW